MKTRFLLLFAAFFSFPVFAVNVSNGMINFGLASEDEKIIRLDGEWEFFKGQTFYTLGSAQLKIDYIQVPGNWTRKISDYEVPHYGCNTYRILISGLHANSEYGILSQNSPSLSARIFANGKFVKEYGKFSLRRKDYSPAQVPLICFLESDSRGMIELVVQVSNFSQWSGGILSPIVFGQYSDIIRLFILKLGIIGAIAGAIIFIFLSNFLIWLFDKSHTQNFCFSIFFLTLFFKVVCGNFNVASLYADFLGYSVQLKLENLALLSFGIFAILYGLDKSFVSKHPKFDRNISFFAFCATLVLVCMPVEISSFLTVILEVALLAFFVYSILRLIFAIQNHNFYIGVYACFYLVFFLGIFLDRIFGGNFYFSCSEFAIIILIFMAVAYLAFFLKRFLRIYLKQRSALSEKYVAYRKFIPSEIPHIFGKASFGKIDLGDCAEINATIMVIGEVVTSPGKTQISMREQFETIGFYSSKIIEIIEQNGGMIVSIGQNYITSFFQYTAKNVINAAHEIQNLLQVMNNRRAQDYYPCVNFNIAMHCGNVLLGIVGSQKQIDLTAISPSIELVNEICSWGYYEKIPVIISEQVVQNLPKSYKTAMKFLGEIKFNEFPSPLGLYGFPSPENSEGGEIELKKVTT